jgi:hypothetical protein
MPAGAAARETPSGAIGLRLRDAPASAGADPRARLYIVDHVAPGKVIQRRIEVSNTTSSTAHVGLYPAAANIGRGSFTGAAGHTRNELSTWTTVRPATSSVAAHGRLTATVTIKVPRDASPGERYAVVWAEVRSAPSGRGITQVSRVGIRLYLSVGPGSAPAADFTIRSLRAERSAEGRPMVIATVRNTGGRAIDMSGTLRLLSGPGGLSAGPFPADLGTTLAIGDTEPVTILLDRRLPAGPWDARVNLHSGLITRSARATITFPGEKKSPWLMRAIASLVLLLLVGIAARVLVMRKRRVRVL